MADGEHEVGPAPGEVEPPWVMFPEYEAGEVAWKRGDAAAHLSEFLLFWEGLGDGEREAYLERWQAPEGWREELLATSTDRP